VILSVLKDNPKHGYEIIKHLEERTQGRYSPSPGTLYPTLQYLEDLGLIRAEQDGDKRVYQLTDAGHAELDKQSSHVEGFWSRFQDRTPGDANMHELRFAADALKDLLRTIAVGFRSGAFSQDAETVRKIRAALERCQNEVRQIIAESASSRPASNDEARKPGTAGSSEERYL
jgi:DNA-binding PadR family transcriptional regulator